jgi:hypothetical protein
MARYQIMFWKDYPAQVKATDERGTAKAELSTRFQKAIDTAAMAQADTSTDDYLEYWAWGPEEEREGTAQEVVNAVVNELDRAYPVSRLQEMTRRK